MSEEQQSAADQIADQERQARYLEKRARINAEVSALIRSPFQRIVADYLACAPSPEAIKNFAEKFPDRYAAALAGLAPLAGFQKEINVQSTNIHLVANLADSTLTARLQAAEQRLIELQQQRLIIEQPNQTHHIAPGQAASHEPSHPIQGNHLPGTSEQNTSTTPGNNAEHTTSSETPNNANASHGQSQCIAAETPSERQSQGESHSETLSHSPTLTPSSPFQARSSADDASIIDVTMRVIEGEN